MMSDTRDSLAFDRNSTSDITNKKSILSSVDLNAILLNASDESIFLLDVDGTCLAVNNIGAKRLNKSESELVGLTVYEMFPKRLADNRKAKFDEVIKTKNAITFLDHRDNNFFENRIFPVIDSSNEVHQLAVFAKNITEKKQSERELQQVKDYLTNFINTVPAAVYFGHYEEPMPLDLSNEEKIAWAKEYGYIYDCNNEYAQLHGYKNKEEVVGLKIYDFYRRNDEIFIPIMEAFIGSDFNVKNVELVEMDQNGNYLYTITNAFSIIEDNKLYSVQGTTINITEKVLLEEKLEKTIRSKDKFLSIISHDLRSPFMSILGLEDMILSNIEHHDFDDLHNYATMLKEASQKTYNLLENLLMWAQTQRNAISFNPKMYSINGLLNEVLNISKQNALNKDILVLSDFDQDHKVFVDKNMLLTAIRNLIANSIKFTPEKGQIDVKTSLDEHHINISISDNGVGMTDEKVNSLFKVDKAKSTHGTGGEKGTGLGLLLCHEFITKNNGSISVESTLNKGSVFTIHLPIQRN